MTDSNEIGPESLYNTLQTHQDVGVHEIGLVATGDGVIIKIMGHYFAELSISPAGARYLARQLIGTAHMAEAKHGCKSGVVHTPDAIHGVDMP